MTEFEKFFGNTVTDMAALAANKKWSEVNEKAERFMADHPELAIYTDKD